MTRQIPFASRRAVLLGGAAIVLASCSDLIGPTQTARQLYPLQPTGGASTAGPKVDFSLAIATTTDSQHLDSARIALIQADGAIDYYANSEWTDHLPVLVQNALVEAFEESGRIDAVASDTAGFHADYYLEAEIRDFQAHYSVPDGIPTVRVRIEAKLAPTRGREIIADLNSVHEVTASANSVPEAVRAFDIALGQVYSEIVNWALAAPGHVAPEAAPAPAPAPAPVKKRKGR
jgi:cholesterol transport system auxiliary component